MYIFLCRCGLPPPPFYFQILQHFIILDTISFQHPRLIQQLQIDIFSLTVYYINVNSIPHKKSKFSHTLAQSYTLFYNSGAYLFIPMIKTGGFPCKLQDLIIIKNSPALQMSVPIPAVQAGKLSLMKKPEEISPCKGAFPGTASQ